MAISVTVSASVTDLTTIGALERDLGLNDTSLFPLLADAIKQASAFILKYTNRTFAQETVTEALPGTGDRKSVV